MLHDPRGALAADDALVHRMIAIAFDIFDGAVLEIDLYPAAAGAHVAGGGLDLVPGLGRSVDQRLGHARLLQDHSNSGHSASVIRSASHRLRSARVLAHYTRAGETPALH